MRRSYGHGYLRPKNTARKNVKNFTGYHVQAGYIIVLFLLVGTVAGAIGANLTDSGSHDAIKSYLTGFFGSFDKNAINLKATLLDSFYKYAKITVAVWVSGFFSPGLITVAGIVLFKSFAYGFTTAALVKYFGFYGFVVGFNSYIPQNLFFLPALYIVSSSAITASLGKISSRQAKAGQDGNSLTEYFIVLFTGLLCCAVAALTETYLTPALLDYIKPL